MMADSWFHSLWKKPRKQANGPAKVVVGVLAFEVASLMSKLVHLWQSLTDKQIVRLREEITNSAGIRKLVSEDEEYVVRLVCGEMIENMGHVARAVARLGKNCSDPSLKNFEHLFDNLIKIGVDQYGWRFSWKKMENKVKKMERLISSNANLYQEMEMLVELEQTFRRMKGNDSTDNTNLLDFQKKIAWKQQEVKNLQDISLWNRTYDYTVYLLARSLFTIFCRIKHVFGIGQTIEDNAESRELKASDSNYHFRSHSVSTMLPSTGSLSENGLTRFASGPLVKLMNKTEPISRTIKPSPFHSGPPGSSTTKSGPMLGANRDLTFYSGPLGKPSTKSGRSSAKNKAIKKFLRMLDSPFTRSKRALHPHHNQPALSFKGCMISGNSTPLGNRNLSTNCTHSEFIDGNKETNREDFTQENLLHSNLSSIFSPKHRLSNAPPETLGGVALALHYANVIVVIEKLVASPHLIGQDARDDLYDMLPTSIRNGLRARLKPYTKSLASSSICDTVLAGEWNDAIAAILDWLAPLAHNTIRWQSERSVEQQNFGSRTHVLLVQTLYFANQEKTEAAITELLVGLNYVWRFGRELDAKALLECASNKVFNEYLDLEG